MTVTKQKQAHKHAFTSHGTNKSIEHELWAKNKNSIFKSLLPCNHDNMNMYGIYRPTQELYGSVVQNIYSIRMYSCYGNAQMAKIRHGQQAELLAVRKKNILERSLMPLSLKVTHMLLAQRRKSTSSNTIYRTFFTLQRENIQGTL